MGVHIGTVSRKRDPLSGRYEYSGVAVTVATELTLRCKGGHVMVSSAVVEAVDNSKFGHDRFRKVGIMQTHTTDQGSAMLTEMIEMHEIVIERTSTDCKTAQPPSSAGSSCDGESDHGMYLKTAFIGSANACRWVIPFEDISIVEENIGQGGYGHVSRGRWKGLDVAVKRMAKRKLDEETPLWFREESALLSRLRHPNVVLFIGVCVRSPNVCVVTEWIPKGTLHDILADGSIKLPWPLG